MWINNTKKKHCYKILPEGVIKFATVPSWTGDFWDVGVPKLSNKLPPSEKLPLSWPNLTFISKLTFLLTAWAAPYEVLSTSPATRPRLSQWKLQDGEYITFLCKLSPVALLGRALSFAGTQQTDPILTHIHERTIQMLADTIFSLVMHTIFFPKNGRKEKMQYQLFNIQMLIDKT